MFKSQAEAAREVESLRSDLRGLLHILDKQFHPFPDSKIAQAVDVIKRALRRSAQAESGRYREP